MNASKRWGISLSIALLGLAQSVAQAADGPRRLSIEDPSSSTTDPAEESPIKNATGIPSESESNLPETNAVTDNKAAEHTITPATKESSTSDTAATAVDEMQADNAEQSDIIADPSERINREIFKFNDTVDVYSLKPVAKGYKAIVPSGLRRCASNIFETVSMPYTAVNNILQGKIGAAGQDVGRIVVNSTFGFAGCFDIASELKIPKHDEDFGQTLGVWGVPSGRYVMLPFFGPSTVRDALSKPIDMIANPIGYINHLPTKNSLNAYKVIDMRTNLLEITDMLDENALDKYSMTRDAWVQQRAAQVLDQDGSYDAVMQDSSKRPGRPGRPRQSN